MTDQKTLHAESASRLSVGFDTELEKKMKLTKAQERAKKKLTNQWLSAQELQESTPTLEGLVRRGEAVQKREGLGSMFCPRTELSYKLKGSNV